MNCINIAGRIIDDNSSPYVIAEVGINHGGDVELARQLVLAAADAGADAVKLQAFRTQEFLAPSSDFFDILRRCELSAQALESLMAVAEERNITLFSSVFDEPSVELMDSLNAPAFKIASGDITHIPLLKLIASKGRPIILSTGGATIGEIEAAMRAIRAENQQVEVALLHCVSNYPTTPEQTNLACMRTLRQQFDTPVGFSDHTLGEASAIAAAALGATIIEKHFTLDRDADGPDHALSADPQGLARLVEGVRIAWQSVGARSKAPVEPPDFIPLIRRSLNARRAMKAGTKVQRDMLAVRRPGTGIAPCCIEDVIGRKVAVDIAEDQPIAWSDLC